MKKQKLFFLIVATFCSLPSFAQHISVTNLKCEYRKDPLGVESTSPSLSWELQSDQRNVFQTAYRVLVADDPSLLSKNSGNIWDSKKIVSGNSIQISYKGKRLQSAKKYYWKVMAWDNKKNISQWSDVATWQMGLFSKTDWRHAQWIALEKLPDSLKIVPALENRGPKGLPDVKNVLPLFRKNFTVTKAVKSATMFICGLGQFELSINGNKTGDHFLDPGWTQFDKEAMYVSFDVTSQLQQGTNTIGVMLGNGFYFIPRQRYRKLTGAFGFPKMISRMLIEYKDGSSANIVSDASWKTAPSPITYSSIYGGEDHNAMLEQNGWDTNSFNERSWENVIVVEGPSLVSQSAEPVKIFEQFSPQKISKVKDSAYVYDMSQNLSGIISITLSGKRGDSVKIIPGELLNADGTVTQRVTGSPFYFTYILKGDGVETWQPRFTYYGFRYLQVERSVPKDEPNPNGFPVMIELKSLHNRNAADIAGTFNCSSDLFNKTFDLINWSVKSNMQSLFTDCPHREKLGWLEQAHLMGSSIRYNYDAATLFKKIVHDMMLSQTPEGLVPEIAPEYVKFDYGNGMFRDSPEWGSSCIILPWYIYQWYGDRQILNESYAMMQRYISYLKTKAVDNILSQGLGDWYDLGPNAPGVSQLTPPGVTATAIYYYDLNIIAAISAMLGKQKEAADYRSLAGKVRDSFNKKFFNPDTKQYATGSQAANAMAVYLRLVEPVNKSAVITNIINNLKENNNTLTAGDIGYRYLLRVLEDAGRSDVIYDMNSRSDVPGYGMQIKKGATALTESWQALPTNSNNHLMLGHLMEWFYSGLCGIKQKEGGVAFREFEISPEPVGDIKWAKATYHSPYGMISSAWKKETSFELDILVPVNTSAMVYLPAKNISSITESGKKINKNTDIGFAGFENGKVKLKVGSGMYSFMVKE